MDSLLELAIYEPIVLDMGIVIPKKIKDLISVKEKVLEKGLANGEEDIYNKLALDIKEIKKFYISSLPNLKPDKIAFAFIKESKTHIDDKIDEDITVGIVLKGHCMLTGTKGQDIGLLSPGKVFILNNKSLHGAENVGNGLLVVALADYLV